MRLNFVVRKSKIGSKGTAPLELSVIINGERKILTLKHRVNPKSWNATRQRVKGDNLINEYIEAISTKFFSIEIEMIKRNVPVTLESVLEVFHNGWKSDTTMFCEYYEKFVKEYASTRDSSLIQYNKYMVVLNYLKEFLVNDINIKNVTPKHIEDFYKFLIAKGQKNNTVVGKMKYLKKVLQMAVDERILETTPFKMKMHIDKNTYKVLTVEEIERIRTKDFHLDRLNQIRDLIIVGCYTGLAYCDLATLTKDDIEGDIIIKNRHKTDVTATIPVIPVVKEILERYEYKLPVPSNQKCNAYVKEIADLCGIEKNLHMHLFRHTYCSLLLNKKVSLPLVSKTMGHSSTKITETIYYTADTKAISEAVKDALL